MLKLVSLFILVPAAELFLLIEMGRRLGIASTLGVIAFTGVLGAWLARRQGLGILERVRHELTAGRMPTSAAADGILVLIAGAVLMTPGVLTDAFGFFCLVPAGRRIVKKLVMRWFHRAIDKGALRVTMSVDGLDRSTERTVRDITPRHATGNQNDSSNTTVLPGERPDEVGSGKP
jgi:UPF0716 protein FxsA